LIKLEKAFASMVRNHRFSRASLKLGGGARGAGFRLLNHEAPPARIMVHSFPNSLSPRF